MNRKISKIKRFRDYGFRPGFLNVGKKNSISDVRGVMVGHKTIVRGDSTRTGVTIVDPGVRDLFNKKIPGAISVGNGFGKMAGIAQVEELGTIETPIVLTNTLAVGPVLRGLVDLVLTQNPKLSSTTTINGIVGETNDGFLNDIHADVVRSKDVEAAFGARSEDFSVGSVGAGTGTRAFSWKGGIGTSSRIVPCRDKKYVVGALLQTNFGGALTVMGAPVGAELGKTDFDKFIPKTGDGSCMIVLATDAPLSARQLKRVANRAFLGLARAGSVLAHGSGDFSVAFSTSREGIEGVGSASISDSELTPFFLAAVEAVEESVYDALFAAQTVKGRDGNVLESLPVEEVLEVMKRYGVRPENN